MEEAPEGGWVGYGQAEVKLAPGGAVKTLESEQKPLRRWGRHKMARVELHDCRVCSRKPSQLCSGCVARPHHTL